MNRGSLEFEKFFSLRNIYKSFYGKKVKTRFRKEKKNYEAETRMGQKT